MGGVLIGSGANSIINGYVNEANGGSFTAGYIGGAVSGGFCALGAGAGGYALIAAEGAAINSAVIGNLALSICTPLTIGFSGNMLGTITTNWIDSGCERVDIDWKETVQSSLFVGTLNVFAGIGSGIATTISSLGQTATQISSTWACRIIAGGIAAGTEAIYDVTTYIYLAFIYLF